MKIAIIGTGLSAMAALEGLRKRDNIDEILIFDSGDLGMIKNDVSLDNRKAAFSKYQYIDQNQNLKINKIDFPNNLQFGGWSNLWGATILPWCENALKYQFGSTELNKYYDLLGDFLEYQADSDKLASEYQLFGKTHKRGAISEIGEIIVKRSRDSKNKNFVIGRSRLAINKTSNDFNNGCIECGECLTGCQYGHIFNSKKYFQRQTGAKITILYNSFVERIIEDNYIKVEYKDDKNNFHIIDKINLVFIATGTLRSAELISRSFNTPNIYTKETPMILIPGFYFGLRKWAKLKKEIISLSEIFIQSKQEKDGVESAGQIYSLNDQIIKIMFPKFFKFVVPKFILKRFIVIMFFVKSREFGYIKVTDNDIQLNIKKYGKEIFKTETNELKKYFTSMKFRLIFSRFFIQLGGKSYHYGGLFLKRNGIFEEIVDCNGRLILTANPRIKVVDGSTLNSLEPGPVTYTIMANSLRISQSIDFETLK